MNKHIIESLLIERAGYVQRGLKDRVAAVDASLRDAGYKAESAKVETATAEPVVETASKPAPKKRAVK
jgi:hypothetical protein